ncbi:MAG: DUF853 family protein, partial [Oscillibacter sp.]|nr:DUF853 family protein [Oscillibacter sp.]
MLTEQGIYIGLAGEERVVLPLNMANRHGLITGASGTGKTVTMKVLAEDFSDAGVPVFLCDMKGDVSGLAVPGAPSEKMEARIDRFGIRDRFSYAAYPVVFWDVFQEAGHPVRATVSDMGPDLLSRILGLTAAQESVLNLVFRIADDHGLLLLDLKDLRTTLQFVGENRAEFSAEYGAVAPVTLQGILRALSPLETQGGDLFFGEPALDIQDWIRTDGQGRGIINLLDCVKLSRSPRLYAVFLLWMLSELFERLPEAGDLDKPKLLFFFDEAHMLFRDAPKVLVQKIEQLVRLIRSKGVGVYFVTQSPGDLPDMVLSQLSHRIQHALRAYTPAEQKAVRAAAASLRPNPAFRAEEVINELGVGEALISLLDETGVPGVVQRAAVLCPRSLMAPADQGVRLDLIAADGMDKYDLSVDNVSAYEVLHERRESAGQAASAAAERAALERERAAFEAQKAKEEAAEQKRQEKEAEAERKRQEREEEAARRKQEREEEAARRKQEREEEAARRKQEREEEAARRKQEREEEAAR